MPSKLAKQCNMAELVQPMLKKVDLRDIKIDVNTTVTIDIEEIKEQLKFKPFENGWFLKKVGK